MNNTTFKNYALSSDILDALSLLNYNEPTEIQQKVIPLALDRIDLAAKSNTGTGKTAAFVIPIAERIEWEENLPQALILEPTRELSVQVSDEVFFIGRKKRLKTAAVFGGFPIKKQIQTLKQKCHVVIGTPGRVMDHLRRGTLNLEKVNCLVIDEADLMLDMGFRADVGQIINAVPNKPQLLLFSATLDEDIKSLANDYMIDPTFIFQKDNIATADNIEEIVYKVNQEEKYKVLLSVLIHENPDTCMIFCSTREMVNVLCRKLQKDKIDCGMIHGDLDQQNRLRTIEQFRNGSFRYLIATDVAARGVDFDNITHVINYDFPAGRETYVHRVGRTARNGRNGKALSLMTPSDEKMKRMIETYTNKALPLSEISPFTLEERKSFFAKQKKKKKATPRKGAALNHNIMLLSIGGGKKSKMRAVDIVGAICNIDGIQADDIGIIDIRDSLTYVEILNNKGHKVLTALKKKPIKGKLRKVHPTRGNK